MGLLLGLLLFGGVCASSAFSTSKKQNEKLARYNAQHEGQICGYEPYAKIKRDKNWTRVYNDWLNDKIMYPVEYVEYFKKNYNARFAYQIYLSSKLDWEDGVCERPKDYFRAVELEFCPCGKIGQKIKIFNETGEFIP